MKIGDIRSISKKSPSKHMGFLDGIALGATIGIIFTLLLCWILSSVSDKISDNIVGFATIVATFFAAFVALFGAWAAIDETQAVEIRNLDRKLSAAKASLPLFLSQLYEVCDNRVSLLTSGEGGVKNNPWDIDSSAIAIFKECIEYSDGMAKDTLTEILLAYQICLARYSKLDLTDNILFETDRLLKYPRIQAIFDWMTLRSLVEIMFEFGRSDAAVIDRAVVADRAIFSLHFLTTPDGFTLDNDSDFEIRIKAAKSNKDFSFSQPHWRFKESI